jgi:hypothetical protein
MPDPVSSPLSSRRGLLGATVGLVGSTMPAAGAEAPQAASGDQIEKLKRAVTDAKFTLLPQVAAYVKRLRARFGPAVLEEVRQATIENSRNWKEQAPIPKEQRNLEHIVADWAQWTGEITYQWVERTPQKLQARVTRCRWAEELKKLGADSETGLAVMCASDYGYCAGLNPAIQFTRTKTLMQGDDHCDHCFELKA